MQSLVKQRTVGFWANSIPRFGFVGKGSFQSVRSGIRPPYRWQLPAGHDCKRFYAASLEAIALGAAWWSYGPALSAESADKRPPPVEKASAEPEEPDPLDSNMACYVCHTTFVKEDLAKTHLAKKVGCVKCHGLSDKHANDENIGATKPDITFKRSEIDKNCAKCHEDHDVSARRVVARFLERHLNSAAAPVCTDCHGHHKIEHAAK